MENKKYQWVWFNKCENMAGVCKSYDHMTESEFLERYKNGDEKRFDFVVQDGFMYVDRRGFKSYPVEYAPSKLLNRLGGAM